ncbi:MAG: AMP-binding protein [Promethearchaeota archaeon]
MKTAKGRISEKKSGNRGYKSCWVYIPSSISKDDYFPFKDKEVVSIELNGDQLIISKNYDLYQITKRYGLDDATLSNLVEKKALINKDLPFIYFEDELFSYSDTNKNSNKIANGLLNLIKKLKLNNPKIALLLPNCPDFVFCWLGIAKTRSVLVAINYLLSEVSLEYILKNSNTEILIIDYNYLSKIQKISTKLTQIKKIIIYHPPSDFEFKDNFIDFQEILSDNDKNPNINIQNFNPLEICYTSGATGKPKCVLYRNYFTLSGISIGSELEDVGFGRISQKIYCSLPLAHTFTRYLAIIPALYYNGSIIIAKEFNKSIFWEDINRYKPDCFIYNGKFLLALVNQQPRDSDRRHSLKYAFGFGALKSVWETFERRFGLPIFEVWAVVEGIGITMNTIGSKGGKIGSIGKPVRGYELKIVDTNGRELPPGRNNIGEIVSRTKLPFELEYYNLQEPLFMKIGQNRWVQTGDFGYKDNEDFVYYLGRQTDMIVRGDETFFSTDIEKIADSHPGVAECAAFEVSIENSSNKEIKICTVVKKDTDLKYNDFHYYLKENLAYFMVPRFIEFKEQLPKNLNELVQKFILKEEWEDKSLRNNTFDTIEQKFLD